jgi:hypothetical protein
VAWPPLLLYFCRLSLTILISSQRKKVLNPVFKASTISGLKGDGNWEEEQ